MTSMGRVFALMFTLILIWIVANLVAAFKYFGEESAESVDVHEVRPATYDLQVNTGEGGRPVCQRVAIYCTSVTGEAYSWTFSDTAVGWYQSASPEERGNGDD